MKNMDPEELKIGDIVLVEFNVRQWPTDQSDAARVSGAQAMRLTSQPFSQTSSGRAYTKRV